MDAPGRLGQRGDRLAARAARRRPGRREGALALLSTAAASAPGEIPLYAAHIHVDHARMAHLLGDLPAAGHALDRAATIYRRLGAAGYLARLDSLRQGLRAAPAAVDLAGTVRP